jgi:hypothetical protein
VPAVANDFSVPPNLLKTSFAQTLYFHANSWQTRLEKNKTCPLGRVENLSIKTSAPSWRAPTIGRRVNDINVVLNTTYAF